MDALTIASISMQNDLQRVDSISQNLANVLTPGYKRAIPVNRSFVSFLGMEAQQSGAPAPQSVLDPSAGTLRGTGNPLDIAIEGNGFFELATENGPAYSRQGALQVDPRGRLTNGQGQPVMGMGGEIFVSGGAFSIDANGNVKQGAQTVGQLKLVQFNNPQALVALGNGLLGQGAASIADGARQAKVRSGHLENSNVNSPQEMIRLTETVRHFESMQRMVQGYDDIFQKTISKLGDF